MPDRLQIQESDGAGKRGSFAAWVRQRNAAETMAILDGSREATPRHGDVWRSRVACRKFTVLNVCRRFDPPVVTGFWWGRRSLRDDLHDAISLPTFLSSMDLVEREDFDG